MRGDGRRVARRLPYGILLLGLLMVTMAGCDAAQRADSKPAATAFGSPTKGSAPPPSAATPLALDCLDPGRAAIWPDARIAAAPDHGSVGTQVRVVASGLQPGCHVTLNLYVPPEFEASTPEPAPLWMGSPIQWLTVGADGAISATFCACETIWLSSDDKPYTVTPVPYGPHSAGYGPTAGDYVFLMIDGLHAPARPTAFARYTFTK